MERWEVALWIVRLLDAEPTSHRAFADVDSDEPYAGYIQTMFDLGVTVGCMVDPLRYCPTRSTSRGEMAAFVTRAYDLEETLPPHGFADVPETHHFEDNISALRNAGVLTADCADGAGLFCPEDPIMAAEAVEWLYRASRLEPRDSETGGGGGGGNGGRGNTGGGNTGGGNTGGGNTGGGNTGGGNTGGGTSGGGTSGGGTSGGGNSGGGTTPTTTTTPSVIVPEFVSNDEIDVVGRSELDLGECTHHDRHFQGGGSDRKSYAILDGRYPVSLVFDDNGPYAAAKDAEGNVHREFFRYDVLPTNYTVRYRYRVERNAIRDVYFSHWHTDDGIVWNYWIPETVLEPVEESMAPEPEEDEVLFEDGSGNKYRRLRNELGGLAYGPSDNPDGPFRTVSYCNDHSHPPAEGGYVPPTTTTG